MMFEKKQESVYIKKLFRSFWVLSVLNKIKKIKKKIVTALSNPQYHVVMDHAMFYVGYC